VHASALLALDEPTSSTHVLATALRPTRIPTDSAFAQTFTAAVNSDRAADVVPTMSAPMLLKLITILELLGAKVPPEFIRALRAHGMDTFADSLEARNRNIDQDEADARAMLRRAQQLASSHTG
jgi:hypothetical protein